MLQRLQYITHLYTFSLHDFQQFRSENACSRADTSHDYGENEKYAWSAKSVEALSTQKNNQIKDKIVFENFLIRNPETVKKFSSSLTGSQCLVSGKVGGKVCLFINEMKQKLL